MRRKVVVSNEHMTLTAVIHADKSLTRDEIENVRDDVADGMMKVVSNARYLSSPLSRITVK